MDEKNLDTETSEEKNLDAFDDEDDDDIEFDDNVNIEALTQQLQQHVDVGEAANMSNEDFNKEPVVEPKPEETTPAPTTDPAENFPKLNCKKYVVYITPNNVEYVDNLSIDERSALINDIISDKQVANSKSKKLKEQQIYYKHLIVACLTVIISFPLLFYAVNKSLQLTINNYQQSQQNFQKLYKEKGKVNSYQKMDIK